MQKTLMKEVKDDTNRYTRFLDWKNQYCENDYTSQSSLWIQCNTYQNTNGIFHRTRIRFSQFIWKHRRPQIAKAIIIRRMELEESTFLISDYTTKLQSSRQYGATTNRNIGQWNKIESPEINPGNYFDTLSLTKEARIYNGEKVVSSISGAGKTGQLHEK